MSSHRLVLNALVLFAPSLLCGQSRHSSPEQRTIEISATEKVCVTAEAATIKIGFQNQAFRCRRRRVDVRYGRCGTENCDAETPAWSSRTRGVCYRRLLGCSLILPSHLGQEDAYT